MLDTSSTPYAVLTLTRDSVLAGVELSDPVALAALFPGAKEVKPVSYNIRVPLDVVAVGGGSSTQACENAFLSSVQQQFLTWLPLSGTNLTAAACINTAPEAATPAAATATAPTPAPNPARRQLRLRDSSSGSGALHYFEFTSTALYGRRRRGLRQHATTVPAAAAPPSPPPAQALSSAADYGVHGGAGDSPGDGSGDSDAKDHADKYAVGVCASATAAAMTFEVSVPVSADASGSGSGSGGSSIATEVCDSLQSWRRAQEASVRNSSSGTGGGGGGPDLVVCGPEVDEVTVSTKVRATYEVALSAEGAAELAASCAAGNPPPGFEGATCSVSTGPGATASGQSPPPIVARSTSAGTKSGGILLPAIGAAAGAAALVAVALAVFVAVRRRRRRHDRDVGFSADGGGKEEAGAGAGSAAGGGGARSSDTNQLVPGERDVSYIDLEAPGGAPAAMALWPAPPGQGPVGRSGRGHRMSDSSSSNIVVAFDDGAGRRSGGGDSGDDDDLRGRLRSIGSGAGGGRDTTPRHHHLSHHGLQPAPPSARAAVVPPQSPLKGVSSSQPARGTALRLYEQACTPPGTTVAAQLHKPRLQPQRNLRSMVAVRAAVRASMGEPPLLTGNGGGGGWLPVRPSLPGAGPTEPWDGPQEAAEAGQTPRPSSSQIDDCLELVPLSEDSAPPPLPSPPPSMRLLAARDGTGEVGDGGATGDSGSPSYSRSLRPDGPDSACTDFWDGLAGASPNAGQQRMGPGLSDCRMATGPAASAGSASAPPPSPPQRQLLAWHEPGETVVRQRSPEGAAKPPSPADGLGSRPSSPAAAAGAAAGMSPRLAAAAAAAKAIGALAATVEARRSCGSGSSSTPRPDSGHEAEGVYGSRTASSPRQASPRGVGLKRLPSPRVHPSPEATPNRGTSPPEGFNPRTAMATAAAVAAASAARAAACGAVENTAAVERLPSVCDSDATAADAGGEAAAAAVESSPLPPQRPLGAGWPGSNSGTWRQLLAVAEALTSLAGNATNAIAGFMAGRQRSRPNSGSSAGGGGSVGGGSDKRFAAPSDAASSPGSRQGSLERRGPVMSEAAAAAAAAAVAAATATLAPTSTTAPATTASLPPSATAADATQVLQPASKPAPPSPSPAFPGHDAATQLDEAAAPGILESAEAEAEAAEAEAEAEAEAASQLASPRASPSLSGPTPGSFLPLPPAPAAAARTATGPLGQPPSPPPPPQHIPRTTHGWVPMAATAAAVAPASTLTPLQQPLQKQPRADTEVEPEPEKPLLQELLSYSPTQHRQQPQQPPPPHPQQQLAPPQQQQQQFSHRWSAGQAAGLRDGLPPPQLPPPLVRCTSADAAAAAAAKQLAASTRPSAHSLRRTASEATDGTGHRAARLGRFAMSVPDSSALQAAGAAAAPATSYRADAAAAAADCGGSSRLAWVSPRGGGDGGEGSEGTGGEEWDSRGDEDVGTEPADSPSGLIPCVMLKPLPTHLDVTAGPSGGSGSDAPARTVSVTSLAASYTGAGAGARGGGGENAAHTHGRRSGGGGAGTGAGAAIPQQLSGLAGRAGQQHQHQRRGPRGGGGAAAGVSRFTFPMPLHHAVQFAVQQPHGEVLVIEDVAIGAFPGLSGLTLLFRVRWRQPGSRHGDLPYSAWVPYNQLPPGDGHEALRRFMQTLRWRRFKASNQYTRFARENRREVPRLVTISEDGSEEGEEAGHGMGP